MRNAFIACLLFALGCGAPEMPSPELQARATELSAVLSSQKAVEEKQDVILEAVNTNTIAITEVRDKVESLEASLVVPKVEPGKEVIQSTAQNPPAKANTALAPSKVATPGDFSRVASDGTRLRWNIEGDWNPNILETSAHLRTDHGIETNGMTHQEMADIHADLHDGKQVATKAKAVRVQGCPGGVCPTNTRRGRGLFGGLFR